MSNDLLPIGHIFTHYGKPYELVEIEPYMRKSDGKPTMLYHFVGECRHPDCAVPLRIKMGAASVGKNPSGTACAEHKYWTTPEKRAEWQEKLRAGRKAWRKSLTAEDKAARAAAAKARWKALTSEQKAEQKAKAKAALQEYHARRRALKNPTP